MNKINKKMNRIYYVISAGGFIFGYSTAVMSGARELIGIDLDLNLSQEGLLVSSLLIGAIVGSLTCTPMAEKIGRKKVLLISALCSLVGTAFTAFTANFLIFIVFRFVLGIGVGGVSGVVPMYLSELSPSSQRGRITSLNSIFNVGGMSIAYVINYLFFKSANWQIMLAIGIIPAAVIILFYKILPESPKWLIEKQEYDEARRISLLIYDVPEESLDLVETVVEKPAEEVATTGSKFQKWMLYPVVLAIFIAIVQQICGANSILYFTPTVLARVGFGKSEAMLSTILIGIIFFIFIVVSQKLIDKVGRRWLLLAGNLGMGLSIIILAFASSKNAAAPILLGLIFIFIMFYSISWAGVTWVVLGEIIPAQVKGIAMGIATACLFGSQALLSQVFPTLIATFSIEWVFVAFGIVNLVAFGVVFLKLPETKGKTLDEIEYYFKKNK